MIVTSLVISACIIVLACMVSIHILNMAMSVNNEAQRNLIESESLNNELQDIIHVIKRTDAESH